MAKLIPRQAFKCCAILVTLSCLTACSLLEDNAEPSPIPSPTAQSIEVFLARAHLKGVDFEHFKVENGIFFRECGIIERGRQRPIESGFIDADQQKVAEALLLAAQTSVLDGKSLPPPGRLSSFFDPGQAKLRIVTAQGETSLDTSLDAIINSESEVSAKCKELLLAIRAIAPQPICRQMYFYGLGRRELSAP